jgi:hypothetical protein
MPTMKKVQMPDGNGGFFEIEGEAHEGSMANAERLAEATAQVSENEAHDHMLKVLQFEQARARDLGLTPEQRAFAMTLLCISMRETFKSGPEAFDKINEAAYDYYLKNS